MRVCSGKRRWDRRFPRSLPSCRTATCLIHATGDFVTADGTRLEGRGVVPDETVGITRAELLAGRDTTLEAALKWIDQQGR